MYRINNYATMDEAVSTAQNIANGVICMDGAEDRDFDVAISDVEDVLDCLKRQYEDAVCEIESMLNDIIDERRNRDFDENCDE